MYVPLEHKVRSSPRQLYAKVQKAEMNNLRGKNEVTIKCPFTGINTSLLCVLRAMNTQIKIAWCPLVWGDVDVNVLCYISLDDTRHVIHETILFIIACDCRTPYLECHYMMNIHVLHFVLYVLIILIIFNLL